MDHWLSEAGDFLIKETEGTSSAKDEVSHKELSSLMRIRDFISLLLTYPVKLEEEGILKSWISAFSEWKAQLLSTNDHAVIDKPWRVLTQKALRCMEGFVSDEIIGQIKTCGAGRSIFDYKDAIIPEAILRLTVDLAVEQLIQTLFSGDDYACNMRHVRLSTRNLEEKRSVTRKIAVSLEEKHNLFGIDKDFLIDASKYESDAEGRVQEEINMTMAGIVIQEDDVLRIEEETVSNRYLVIVMDGDSDKKLDLTKVRFPVGIVVFITTEPSAQAQEDDEFRITCTMDLNINTQDHLLPWEVFRNYVGIGTVHSSRAIQRIAVQIIEECRGHLLAIVLVAKSLKNVEDVKRWEVALNKLSYTNPSYDYQESDRIGISRVMVNAFVNIILVGITKQQKLCLEQSLFVSKIKNGVPCKVLMSEWISTGFMFDSTIHLVYTRKEAERNIRELLDRSILLRCETINVYLPVDTYAIIESLHKSNPSIIRHDALGLTEPPYIGRWHGLIRIELRDNKICELPQSPNCPNLEVLLLQGNVDLMDIPNSFFDHMPRLRHLDLSYTSIRDLPPSISKLIELKKFFLRGCDLFMELPPQIGQLKNLEELDLDGTLITHLPKEIRELINLQRLTLCFDRYLDEFGHGKAGKQISNSTIIPPGVISNLTQLNYLSINVDPEDERWSENVTNILVEIFALERLKMVNIYVPKAELLELIPAQKSLDLRLVVGHHMQRFISRVTPEVEEKFKRYDYIIKFVNGVNIPNGVKMNLGRFRALYLDRHMTIKSLSEFELKNLEMLRVCILAECNEMETVVDGYDGIFPALPNLESLSVFYMKNLRSICEGIIPYFLGSLKSMALHTCPMLTTVFTLSFLGNLSLLEELIVEDCPKVTTLISHDSSELETQCFLPRLRVISLLFLPELVSIFNGYRVGQGLEEMRFYYCPKLRSLSKRELSSEYLEVIKGESRWLEALEWNHAEWGVAVRPNFLDQIFSPINEEADIMTQRVTHHDEDKFRRKRKRCGPLQLQKPPLPAIRVSKKSHKIREPSLPSVNDSEPILIYDVRRLSPNYFMHVVQCFIESSLSEITSSSEKETVQSGEDDITQMLETSMLREAVEEKQVECHVRSYFPTIISFLMSQIYIYVA